MLLKRIIAAVAAACLSVSLLGIAGCSNADKTAIIGEWLVQDTTVTVVFSDTEFKMVGNTLEYDMNTSDKTITYGQGVVSGTALYDFSEDGNTLTFAEDDGDGGQRTTTFVRVSTNGDAEPTAFYEQPAQDEQAAQEGQDKAE